ncbi:MAG: hypothetical protein JKX97_01525, partial [Candidatus Lindowbacteria bacterium]|nr:hypothetical protein [Candidatus Lindowbacteria bacterium]
MADGMLTQEEIDALLSGAAFDGDADAGGATDTSAPPAAAAAAPAPAVAAAGATPELGEDELKALGERLKVGMASSAEVTSTLLGRTMALAPVSIDAEDDNGIKETIPGDAIAFDFVMSGAASGTASLVLPKGEVIAIAAILMGTEGELPDDLDDLHESAAKEGIKQLISGLATALSRELMGEVTVGEVDLKRDAASDPPLASFGRRVLAQFSLALESRSETSLNLIIENGLARALAGTSAPTAAEAPVAAIPTLTAVP